MASIEDQPKNTNNLQALVNVLKHRYMKKVKGIFININLLIYY